MKEKVKGLAVNVVLIAVTAAAAVALGSQAPSWYKQWRGPAVSGDFSMHVANQPHKLTLYGTKTCKFCKAARAYLDKAGIPFNDLLVDESKEASKRYSELGQEGVPVLVSGKELVVGFNEKAYNDFVKSNVQQ